VSYHFPKEYDGLTLAIRNCGFNKLITSKEEVPDTVYYMYETDKNGDTLTENDYYYIRLEDLLEQFN